MAILSKIRDRSLILILIIGMALFAFVASPDQIMGFFQSNKANSVGTINGEDVSREEFATQIKAYQAGRANVDDTQAANVVWNNLMSEKIYASQLDKAGIVVGEKDIWEALVSDPSIQKNPQFLNEAGLFNEESLKSYIADLKDDATVDGKNRWMSWLQYERNVKQNLERNAYLNLVKAGLGVSSAEAKEYYITNNTKVFGKYVMLPYTSVADSTIKVTDSDIQSYINKHENEFQTKALRTLQYVKFDLAASEADKKAIKSDLAKLINDNEEYNNVIKDKVKVTGLKNTEDYKVYLSENSDTPYNENYIFKNALKTELAEALFELKAGDVYGPYEDAGFYKISKVVALDEVPSAKASHILIAYEGAMRANPTIKRTKEEAKAIAEKVLKKIKKSSTDFAAEAKVSSDGSTGANGGSLGWFKEGQMTKDFNDWVFSHKKGQIGLVETEFGFHIIKMDDTKSETGLKLATVSKIITPSEETENKVFVEAETFAANISKGEDFKDLAKEKNYIVKYGKNIGKRDESIPGLVGNNRSLVYWAFDENTEIGNSKRFDIDKAYVVSQLVGSEEKGLQSIKNAKAKVMPLVIKDKKYEILSKKLSAGTLDEIAKNENQKVQNTRQTSFENPATAALGRDKSIVGALLGMKVGDIARTVRGTSGVYAIELISKTPPKDMSTYETYRVRLENELKRDNRSIFEALKEASDVEDYRD